MPWLFIKTVGWENFSVTVIELWAVTVRADRESWYLKTLLNTKYRSGEGQKNK